MLFLVIVGLMTACSSSRYAANFHYYKSNTSYDEVKPKESIITPIQPERLVASANKETALVTEEAPLTTVAAAGAGTQDLFSNEQGRTQKPAPSA